MRIRRQDTETYPIRPGLGAPQLVCVQWAIDEGTTKGPIRIDLRKDALGRLEADLLDPDLHHEHHNGAFDYAVLCAAYPHLTRAVFNMLGEGRGRDTLLRQQLQEIAAGTMPEKRPPKGYWSLAGLNKRLRGVEMAKGEDTFRLRYALLDGVPVGQWPQDAIDYATDDIVGLRGLSDYQAALPYQPPDEWAQVAAAFCLQLAAVWGLHVDADRLEAARDALIIDDRRCVDLLTEAGLFRDGSVKQDAVRAAVERACKEAGTKPPRTAPSGKFPEGQVRADAETCEDLAEYDPVLTLLSEHNTNSKMLTTYLEPMAFGTKYAMGSRPNALVNTGRTSWGGGRLTETNPWWPEPPEGTKYDPPEIKVGTNLQNWPAEHGIRDCVKPRPGFYFASVDYNSLELRTLGQACLWLLGRSTFAEGYQKDPNWDPHTYFGGRLVGLDYVAALERKATDKTFKKGPRATGKATNFALPGGVGARRMQHMFLKMFKDGDLPKAYSLDECYGIKAEWLNAYPEMQEYFDVASWHVETGTPVKQLVSNRVRRRVTFPSCANTWFQGLAADLAKRALFYVTRACYADPSSPLFGSRVVAFIHDEIFLEVPIEKASEAARETERLMVLAATELCPDVPFQAEAALMTYWTKKAEPKFDLTGGLIPSH
jgi:DNA polymerase-1